MENPSDDESEIPTVAETNTARTDHNLWNVDDILNDSDPEEDLTSVIRKLHRHAPPRIAQLPEGERIDYVNRMVTQYQKSDAEKARDQINKFTRLNYHPIAHLRRVYKLEFDELFVESFRVALQTTAAEDIVNRLPVDDSIDGVYKFNMMTRRSCRMISLEIQAFNQWCIENTCRTNPPSVFERAVVLNYFGLETIIGKVVKYLEPVLKAYFGCDGEIDSQFSFSVTFGLRDGEHRSIDPNYGDDSDLTIKLCLSDMDSTGAQLVFGGRKCFVHETMQEEAPLQVIEVEMGQVVLHCGRHRNGFTPIERYSKEYLIIWCKSHVLREMNQLERSNWCIVCERLRKERLELDNAISGRLVRPLGGSPSGESPAKEPKMDNAIDAVDGTRVRPEGRPGSPSGEARKKKKM